MITILLQCCQDSLNVVKCICANDAMAIQEKSQNLEIICNMIIWVTAIIVGGVILWKFLDLVFYGVSETCKRDYDVEDRKNKQRTNLLEKKLALLKEKEDEGKSYAEAIDKALEDFPNY